MLVVESSTGDGASVTNEVNAVNHTVGRLEIDG